MTNSIIDDTQVDSNVWPDFWYYYIGANCIPFDSKNKSTYEQWSRWQDQPVPNKVYEKWKENGSFDKGIAVIAGKIWRGKYKDNYLACLDFDNEKGIDEFLTHFGECGSLDKIAQKTIVEQHTDDLTRGHLYFIVEKPLTKKSGIGIKQHGDIKAIKMPAIEVKSEGKHGTMIVTPSIHKNGHPYEIIGTKEPMALNKEQSEKLEKTLNEIYAKFGKAESIDNDVNNLIPLNELFKDDFVVYGGNNRQEFILRIMDSLISRNQKILSEEQIKALAQDINQKHCKPPLDKWEFEKKWTEAKKFVSKNTKKNINHNKTNDRQLLNIEEKNTTDVQDLVETIQQRCNEIFLDEFHDPYVSIKINDHYETLPLEGKRFQSIIISEHYKNTKSLLNKERLSQIIDLIKANAELNPEIVERILKLRVARNRANEIDMNKNNKDNNDYDCYYYDLTNPNWEIVKITKEGWTVVSNTKESIFRRYKNSTSQSFPSRHYDPDCIDKLLNLFNLNSQNDKLLLLIYIVSLFVPDIAKPMLLLYGSKGAAKTTSFELIKNIVDPAIIETLSFPKDVNDLVQTLSHSYVSYFDNITSISQSMSDLLCRVVTGSSYAKRTIYTVDDTFIYKLKKPIGINGINIASARPDFLDRCLIIEVNRISKERRRKEEDVKAELKQLIPDILGWIFDILVKVLKYKYENPDKIILKEYPRMADFAEYGEIVARCIGFKENEFIHTYFENIEMQNEEVIESSIVAKVIIEFMEEQIEWEGPATYLHSLLSSYVESKDSRLVKSKAWPNAGNSLSRKIKELTSTLREKGIDIIFGYNNKIKSRVIKIRKMKEISSYRSSGFKIEDIVGKQGQGMFISSSHETKEAKIDLPEIETLPYVGSLASNDRSVLEKDKVVQPSIHEIARKLYPGGDVWICNNCSFKGDKFDLLSHPPYCKNIKK